MSTISSASSRKFNFPSNISSNTTTSATKPAPTAKTPETGQSPRSQGMQFRDVFDTGSTNTSSSSTSAVSGTGPGSKAFADKLHNTLQSAGVDEETIKTVLGGLNDAGSSTETSASSEDGSADGVTAGSEAFGDKLHSTMQSAGVDEETIKTVLGGLNSGEGSVDGATPGSEAFADKLHNTLQSAGVDDETIKTVLGGLNDAGSSTETSASSEDGEDSVGGVTAGSEAFGDKLHNTLQSAGVDEETIKTVLGGLNSGEGGEDSVDGVTPGSKAFGDKLHHAMQSAGVDEETIKTVLGGLNDGQTEGAQSDTTGLDTLMSKLDTDSSSRLQTDDASLEQLINNPQLTAQLAQAPELFKLLMNQGN